MTSSPESFYYMIEGYYDKEEQLSTLLRVQTYCIVTSLGAKLKGGGEIKPHDLWKLKSDIDERGNTFKDLTKEEYREWYSGIKNRFKLQ